MTRRRRALRAPAPWLGGGGRGGGGGGGGGGGRGGAWGGCHQAAAPPAPDMTRPAFENAIAVVMATGGSTNAVLTCWRWPMRPASPWSWTTSRRYAPGSPVICDLKPSGQYVITDLHKVGGIPQVMKMLLVHGLLHGDCITITGQTIAELLRDVPDEPPAGQDVIHPFSRPLYPEGHLASSVATWLRKAASPRSPV